MRSGAVVVRAGMGPVDPALRARGAEVGLGRGLFAGHDHAVGRLIPPTCAPASASSARIAVSVLS